MQEKIEADIVKALKGGDKSIADCLKYLKSVINNVKINAGHNLSDEEITKIIRKEIKSRTEARDLYLENNRTDLAEKEEFERKQYLTYVPQELSTEEIEKIIFQTINNIEGEKKFANVMPVVMKQISGRADGKIVSQLVSKIIQKGE